MNDCGFELIEHPPSSPEFHLFPELKRELSGKHYADDYDAISTVDEVLHHTGEPSTHVRFRHSSIVDRSVRPRSEFS